MIFISEIRSKIIQKNILCTNKSPMVLPKSCQFFAQTHSFFFLGGGDATAPLPPAPLYIPCTNGFKPSYCYGVSPDH